ncbi:galactose-binding like protein [Trichodelitschia bisporula]|uniref:Galactose-binding like protein n=1 Tax=Trichodelitschia bisporula TaxID=703511 RepID=A0A6G1HKU3_9PEZI|nr:galactose-binding like protein [Trichodelitschia bisporula]
MANHANRIPEIFDPPSPLTHPGPELSEEDDEELSENEDHAEHDSPHSGQENSEEEEEEVEEDPMAVPTTYPPPPDGLKEVSSLASWTVSSNKPGCGVAELRQPTTSSYWQSDGPQPHHLNIHFFKMVELVSIRIYLDFELDESYTPTVIKFFAGTGYNDLQEFSVMTLSMPRGWLNVDFAGVMAPKVVKDDVAMTDADEDSETDEDEDPFLRCMLVQVRVCENHQNGKDTHLRAVQLFAKDAPESSKAMDMEKMGLPIMPKLKKAKPRIHFSQMLSEDKEWDSLPVLR